ncbi:reverse transcriptase domain-containing protein [Pedobacter gandavensis]|uniref:reverse transcriptase/maturase family protein n=1 Tax=Pedobacter gandavensis TaxID=2679963 RepID=UPI00247ABF67|nr:reverse transcriptase/maturase family protein [Pedobacter gandavensis]WGQ09785.1 reverse transcriptase domain-containing protein [Pedobacter gandavensis]WGQ09937.1 reverse transcriptase domain-containing protein [Pedobacter gandavensis]WGQ10931.1 reverse transcriptase domain-containing protein [Pedobacter gandavensis]WGQ11372.1 reverse transcriptase domain-containing protein [Pedobacter gandavensis]
MRDPEQVLNALCEHSKDSGYRYQRLYRILFNEEMFFIAYQRKYANQGNMTPGTDGRTVDRMSIPRIQKLVASLRDESYQPHPARRVYIPKKNGTKRPLGIPSFEDKLVQEVVHMILKAIYEGQFENTSHGFRPNRSCHTALRDIKVTFKGTRWFIEGDIKGFFDNINHSVMIDILRERISDDRFLRLIRKFLNAGYMENWTYNNTYSGTPQGGIISPILANIYLDKFDKYVKQYAESFNKGKARRLTTEYQRNRNQRNALRWKMEAETDENRKAELKVKMAEMRTQMLDIPATRDMDDTFRRLKYIRYADDFLIGVIGSKGECEKIKADITTFMSEKLKLEMSEEKTLITSAQEPAKFLGYEITARRSMDHTRTRCGLQRRPWSGTIVLNLSYETVIKRLQSYNAVLITQVDRKKTLKPSSRKYMVNRQDADIMAQYNLELRGFYNYYSIADNIAYRGWKFNYFMKYSMLKTLGRKHKRTVGQILEKYKDGTDVVIPYRDNKGNGKQRVWYNGGFKCKRFTDIYEDNHYDKTPNTMYLPAPTLVERLKERKCELCGVMDDLVMHHVRNINQLKADTRWNALMIKRHRKTLAVCHHCDALIHKSYDK